MKQKFIVMFFLIAFIAASATRPLVAAESRISIGVTETMETFNPYGDSVALMYSVWCQVLGCLFYQAAAKYFTGRERSGGRQIHGANHNQRADGAAARLSF